MAEALPKLLPTPPRLRLCRRLLPLLAVSLLVNPITLRAAGIIVPYKVSFLWSPLYALAGALALACSSEIAIALLRPSLALIRGDGYLVLDEGGVRIVRPRPRPCSYFPYETIGACALCDNGMVLREVRRVPVDPPGFQVVAPSGATLIAYDVRGEPLFDVALRASSTREAAEDLLDTLQARSLDDHGSAHLQSLRRRGRSLGAWASQLRDLGCGAAAGPYRSLLPSPQALEAAIVDPTLPVDIRVGAVFAASTSGRAVSPDGIGPHSPPLLLAALDSVFPSRRTARLVSQSRIQSHLSAADWCALRELRVAARIGESP